jgi:hypothetical protein
MNYIKSSFAAIFASIIVAMFLLCLISAVQIVNANGFQSNLTAREKQKSAFNTMQREESSEKPPDVSFTIRLTEGKAISAG